VFFDFVVYLYEGHICTCVPVQKSAWIFASSQLLVGKGTNPCSRKRE